MVFISPGAEIVTGIGRREGDAVENVLVYDREGGSGQFYRPTGDGDLQRWRSYAFGEGAFAVISAHFTLRARRDFLAYFPQTGRGRLHTMAEDGRITRGAAVTLGTGWTHLVRGIFSASEVVGDRRIFDQDVLLYNARTGMVRVFTSDGQGHLSPLSPARSWEAGWSLLVPGFFGGRGPGTDLLAYRRMGDHGTGRFFTTDLQGRLSPLSSAFEMPGASHVARGRFGFGPDAGDATSPRFLCYDSERGQMDAIAVSRGQSSVLVSVGAFPRRWTHLVVGDFAGERRFSDFLFYDATNGQADLWEWTDDGPRVQRPAIPPTPPPAPGPDLQSVCAQSPIPAGYILVDDCWDPTRCGQPAAITNNVWVIQRYSAQPVGAVLTVCASAPTPAGWVEIDRSWNPNACGHPSSPSDNVKRIQRVR